MKTKMKARGGPHPVNSTTADEAWWYADTGGVDVVMWVKGNPASVRITRKRLAEWIKASERKK